MIPNKTISLDGNLTNMKDKIPNKQETSKQKQSRQTTQMIPTPVSQGCRIH